MDMGYRIIYGPQKKVPKPKRIKRTLVIICILALVAAGRFLDWGECLIPGDPAVTFMAAEALIADLRAGIEVKEAFSDFCREIMDHGTLY